jgi:hypothetical protein
MSSVWRPASSLNSFSMCPGEKTVSIRIGASERLHQACGTLFLIVTAVPAEVSAILPPLAIRTVHSNTIQCSSSFLWICELKYRIGSLRLLSRGADLEPFSWRYL